MSVMVTLPTYNEAENIRDLIADLLGVCPDMSVVVIDDDSPDGTFKIVQEMMQSDQRIHLIHRTEERGRGTAGARGFEYALEQGADLIVEMDADYSHHPRRSSHCPAPKYHQSQQRGRSLPLLKLLNPLSPYHRHHSRLPPASH